MDEHLSKIAIQDAYGDKFQHCWGCGQKNDDGLKIKSYPTKNGDSCICYYKPRYIFTGGVPNNLFGGMIAMIFDCHGAASAAWYNYRKTGVELTEYTIIKRYITARLEVDYLKPIPIDAEVKVISTLEEISDRKVIVSMVMEVLGNIYAKSRIVTVAAKDNM